MRGKIVASILVTSLALLGAAQAPQTAKVDGRRIIAASPNEWLSYGRTYDEQRYSPLTQITPQNANQLGLTWFADFDTNRGQESTPIVVDGVMYVSTAWSKVYAFDAATGRQIWMYDPKVPGEWGGRSCCDVVNRGVAVWNGKIYVATIDGRLVAINAASGQKVWETNTIDRTKNYSITGAPRVVKGKVIIGNAGAEFGVRGYVSAYDAETGEMDWRFFTVPGNPADGFEDATQEMIAKTWTGEWWKLGGGGTAWDALTYDPVTDLLYIGVGNGSPWNPALRSPGGGDNLFLSSIVAVDPDTGEYKWHYQTTPREAWDYTAVQQITVADLRINGRNRHVVMQMPKNGFFYVLDARTGELLSADAVIPLTWATGVDMKTGRPIENPAARYEVTGQAISILPHAGGGHNWHPWSFSPKTGLMYIPVLQQTGVYGPVANFQISTTGTNTGVGGGGGPEVYTRPGAAPQQATGFLIAWDPVARKEAWRVDFDGGRGGGTVVTASGLVFQGNSKYEEMAVYRADNGQKLWSSPAQTGIVAAPITYSIGGVQYVAVVAGRNENNYYADNQSRILVYKLGGTAQLPPEVQAPIPPIVNVTPYADLLTDGQQQYNRLCGQCHGNNAGTNGQFPDLKRAPAVINKDDFAAVVLGGERADQGMPAFTDTLNEAQTENIRNYILSRAQASIAQAAAPAGGGRGGGAAAPAAGAGRGAAAAQPQTQAPQDTGNFGPT